MGSCFFVFFSGFAGAAVVESGEGTKVVDSDAARENEAYKKASDSMSSGEVMSSQIQDAMNKYN